MKDSETARAYLVVALEDRGIAMKTASEAAGMNHAYLQQYIQRGKPRWLPEPVRLTLVQKYGLDGSKLRPPPARSRAQSAGSRQREDHSEIDTPRFRQLVNQP